MPERGEQTIDRSEEQVKTPEHVITSRKEAEQELEQSSVARKSIEAVIAQIEDHQ